MTILSAFGLVALGVAVDRIYSIAMWRKYYEGRNDGEYGRRRE